jgi:hypothetical protein
MAVDGSWKVTMETPMGARTATAQLTSAGGSLTGTMSGDAGATEIFDGTVSGNSLAWKTKITQPMALTLEFAVSIDGDKMTGTVQLGMFGAAPLTGSRA